MRIAAIDQGTTSTRALLLAEDGGIALAAAREHTQIYPRDGWVEHDPEALITNIMTCLEACGPLDAIGIDNQGESCLAWDAVTKQALSPVLVWQDNRSAAAIEALRSAGAETETLSRAGLPLDPYFSAAKLAWILTTRPEAQDAHKQGRLRLGTTDAFFLDRLTGRFVTDVTTASRTSLMNLTSCTWDETLCDLFGIPIDCLPEITTTTGVFGAIRTSHGLVPVTASITDQQAALHGFGCRTAGDAKITFGTGAFALMITGETLINRPDLGLLPTIAWQEAGQAPVRALDGGVFSASAAINWAHRLGLFDRHEAINSFPGPAAIDRGLVFVPALSGLGCPHWQPEARGSWMGLSLDHDAPTLMQAILEGVALRATEVVEAMHACMPLSGSLRIDGGMSRNPYFVQFLADATGRRIEPAVMPELTGLGTIQLACKGMGITPPPSGEFGYCIPKQHNSAWLPKFRQAVRACVDWGHAPSDDQD